MTRKNAVAILMGIELILNSANINFIAFNRFITSTNLNTFAVKYDVMLHGHLMGVFVIVLAAAEAAVALAIIINLYKSLGSVNVNEASSLKG